MKRDINGIILLDKPIHLTSNTALQKVKRLLNAKKAGHTGALDPLATGMLPICFGDATKFSQFLLDADKAYQVTATLGSKTTTSDSEGDVIATAPVRDFSADDIETVLSQFRGPIMQVPSMYSALKHEGQPLYRLARKGVEIERPARPVTIYELTLVAHRFDSMELFVRCSKGTYIRNLVEDIGDALGCYAHVSALRRLYVDPFEGASMLTLEEINENTPLMAVEAALKEVPVIRLEAASAAFIKNGRAVTVEPLEFEGMVSLYDDIGQFLGIGSCNKAGQLAPKRLLKKVTS